RVYRQLQEDYHRLERLSQISADHASMNKAHSQLEESLEYIQELSEWMNQDEFLTTNYAELGKMMAVELNYLPQTFEGLCSENICYFKVKHIRDSIYGSVDVYQL